MQDFLLNSCLPSSAHNHRFQSHRVRRISPLIFVLLLLCCTSRTHAQSTGTSGLRTMANHHPQWANAQNDAGALPASQTVDNLTIVLARTPEQEAAFKQFMEDQQNPASPSYHDWLSPQQIGQRFGPSQDQITAVISWLQSQNLTVSWIAPSGGFLGFRGAAVDLGRALHTELHAYTVHGAPRISVASDPVLPASVAANIRAIRGLYTIEDRPLHHAQGMQSSSPDATFSNGSHLLAPADFDTIYDIPSSATGAGQTIGIVGRSRTYFTDFDRLRNLTNVNFPDPIEIVPTAFGGVDPGPAYTAPPTDGGSTEDQLEATLDVIRAGSVAPASKLLLVVSSDQNNGGGIASDALYLTQTYPLPAQVMNVSFGACELDAGADGVQYWDSIFQQASSEGISVFVASGDAGAAGCDSYFDPPPAAPEAISPNYICSTGYATCVGGTEFADTANPSQYWSPSSGPGLSSALSYIPEGAWNEPLAGNSTPQADSSGGGVSQYIPTPAWQTGTGVPSARAGRYTPDLAFSSSSHDGYFVCFAALGADCNSNQIEWFFGTSAAAPSMAGITALLDQQLGQSQGNLNPELYALAASSPTAFHDVTVATSGVTSCQLSTPSMCNNSLPGHTALTGGETGYLITAGYDEVTGLGSLDVGNFLASFKSLPAIRVSAAYITFANETIGSTAKAQLTVQNAGSTALDPISASIGTQSGSGATFTETNDCNVTLASGDTCTVHLSFTPTELNTWIDTLTLTSANATNPSVTVLLQGTGINASAPVPPQVTVLPIASQVYSTQPLPVIVSVSPATGEPVPTGSIVLSSGSYSSPATALSSGSAASATITIPANTLPVGSDILTATYTPDAASTALYTTTSNTATVTILAGPAFTLSATGVTVAPGATTGNTSTVTVTPVPSGGFTGSVVLTAAVTSVPATSQNPPTVSLGSTGTVNITGATAGTATVTVSTTPATTSSCTNSSSQRQQASWYGLAGPFSGAALAFALFFCIPARRRAWRNLLGLFLLLAAFTSAITACGGSGSGCGATVIHPGTTTGSYVVTVTGTSGSLSTTTTFAVTVQ